MSDTKDLLFVRHTETVAPDAYDFDLTRRGKRDARIIGWHLARQELLSPIVVFHFDLKRAASMAACLVFHYAGSGQARAIRLPETISLGTDELLPQILKVTQNMDLLAPFLGGQAPKAVVYVVHRQCAEEFDFIGHVLTTEEFAGLKTLSNEQKTNLIKRHVDVYEDYAFGEVLKMRFPVNSWSEVREGSGRIVERLRPRMLRTAYKDWCRRNYDCSNRLSNSTSSLKAGS